MVTDPVPKLDDYVVLVAYKYLLSDPRNRLATPFVQLVMSFLRCSCRV